MKEVSRRMLSRLRGLIDWRGKITEDGNGNVYVRGSDNNTYKISQQLVAKLNPMTQEKIRLRLFISRFLTRPMTYDDPATQQGGI